MGSVVVLRELWRRRALVALSGLLALAIALLMTYRFSPPFSLESRSYTVGIASTTALLDTPTSQVVDLGDESDTGPSAASLPARAALLANVMTTSPLKEEIAKEAGIDPRTLVAGAPAPGSLIPDAPIGSISVKSRKASLLTVSTYEGLPMLGVSVTAPDERTAARLSNGAIKILISHLNSLANADGVPASRRLVVKQLGDARVATSQRGPSRKLAAVGAVFIFGLLCATILGVSFVVTRWDRAENWDSLSRIDWDKLAAEHFEPMDAHEREANVVRDSKPDPGRTAPQGTPSQRWDSVS